MLDCELPNKSAGLKASFSRRATTVSKSSVDNRRALLWRRCFFFFAFFKSLASLLRSAFKSLCCWISLEMSEDTSRALVPPLLASWVSDPAPLATELEEEEADRLGGAASLSALGRQALLADRLGAMLEVVAEADRKAQEEAPPEPDLLQ